MASNGNLKLDEPVARISQTALIAAIWVLVALAFVFIVGRCGTRLYVFKKLHIDDGFAVLAFAILVANGAVVTIMAPSMYELLAVSVGVEQPTPAFLVRASFYLKCQFTSTLLFWACLWSVKASFLAFFRQLTAGLRWPRRAWWVVVGITTLAFIGSIITYPLSCTSFVLGECQAPSNVDLSLLSLRFSTAVDIITDVFIIAIPISIVARVQVSTLQKAGLLGILGMGVVIIGFAIARIIVTDTQGVHPEISWLALWSAIENSVAVIVCCLASFKALFTAHRQSSGRQQYHAGSASVRRRTSKGQSASNHGEVRMDGPSAAKPIPLHSMKGAEYGVGQEQWMDDSSSQLEILGDSVRHRDVT